MDLFTVVGCMKFGGFGGHKEKLRYKGMYLASNSLCKYAVDMLPRSVDWQGVIWKYCFLTC